MKKSFVAIIALLLSLNSWVRADEGMWLLNMLNQLNLNQKGLVLSAEDIYSINHSSLKDAVVGLGNENNPFRFFCTGEIISDQGLVLTNHHCGYESIQSHSSEENDYLTDGFWAMNKDEELTNEGMTMSILVRMEEVSGQIVPFLSDTMSLRNRRAKIAELSKDIKGKALEGTQYGAIVKSMFEGNKFYLFVYETFKDIRLVGAAPSSIGKFGGDTDNWMWPRHTGDFSMFRIYSAPDGKPATYAKENVPYSPKHHFPVSLSGYQKGSFAMVMGFPGSTDRYRTSYGIQQSLDVVYPARIEVRGKKLDVMKADMDQSDKVRIQYASKYARVSNYWKYFIGQSKGLKRLKVYDKKKAFEKELQNWIDMDAGRKEKYGNALQLIADSYAGKEATEKSLVYYTEGLFGIETLLQPMNVAFDLSQLLADPDQNAEKIKETTAHLKESANNYYKDFNQPTDKQMFIEIMKMFTANVPVEHQPDMIKAIAKKSKGNFAKYADKFYVKTIFADQAKYTAFLENPSLKVMKKDPAYQLFMSVLSKYRELQSVQAPFNKKFEEGRRLFEAAMLEFKSQNIWYPDANSTPRFTYGYVGDYQPADAVHFNYYTTLDGILEKEDPTNDEFVVADRLKELAKRKDYGQYASADGKLHVCFTTNNDITGGNSGSPVINAKGELIGAAFDGNWEAMSGDIAFEPGLQKCINVDIRYVLWVIDKFAGAGHLVKEMDLVYDKPSVKEPEDEPTEAPVEELYH